VTALLADPERRARMGAAAAHRARVEFDEQRVCARVVALYRDLLALHRDPGVARPERIRTPSRPAAAPQAAAGGAP
jgi:hypothetical protein